MVQSTPRTSRFAFLGELLVDQGLISEEQLAVAINEQKRRKERLGKILIDSGFCTEKDIAQTLATQLGLEVLRLTPSVIEHAQAERFDDADLRAKVMIPVVGGGSLALRLAVADPFDVDAVNLAETITGLPVDLVVATATDIVDAIDGLASHGSGVEEMLQRVNQGASKAEITDQVSTESLVLKIISDAVKRDATDIHLEPDHNVLRIRYRIDGVLVQGAMVNLELSSAVIARVKVISNLDISETRLPQDGRSSVTIDGTPYDLRVSVLPTVVGENVVIRLLDTKNALLDPRKLGLSERNFLPLMEMVARPHGIILVTGPTGSGKSTTLYSLLKTINALENKIITVEDPVEYRMPLVRQVQVHAEIGMTFAAALRSILRQDPDVILVGEVRDTETAQI
ncbi:MAG: Flp pilus assembly complex ATPase component TadA, partial [Planctomycetes bacterium]|nr:Flp pilus assembly complex ATPase component TadA [Planctomycetota bacterium]